MSLQQVESSGISVRLVARPSFVGDDIEEFRRCRSDQMQGTEGEKIAEFAGRGCYDSFGRGRNSDDFHANILEHYHPNVLYHSHFVLWITGVTRNLSHELVRHHVGFSPSQRSTRYVSEAESRVMMHPDLSDLSPELHEKLTKFDMAWRDAYKGVVEHMVAKGHDRKTAQGAAARILPNGIETRLTWSGNAAAFLQMFPRRDAEAADKEFRILVTKMWQVIKPEMPRYFSHWSPSLVMALTED
jgi:thymidylate synthase (FAD)